MRAVAWLSAPALLVLACGCGSDFKPKEMAPTGEPAAPLGQVVDLEVSLPNLLIMGALGRGADFDMKIEIEDATTGRHDARYVVGRARYGMGSADVEDLSNGRTTVTISESVWTTGRIGPLRIDNTVFELVLDGEPRDGGWFVSGRSRESQTTLFGTFQGWRRHRFLVATTDFFSGGRIAEVSLVKGTEIRVRENLVSVSTDPVLRRTARSVFAVNRLSFDLHGLPAFLRFTTPRERTSISQSLRHAVAHRASVDSSPSMQASQFPSHATLP